MRPLYANCVLVQLFFYAVCVFCKKYRLLNLEDMENWSEVVAGNLKKWREAYGWSQEVLAEKAECSKSVVRDLEAQSRGASIEMLSKLAGALNIDLRTLFTAGETPKDLNQTQVNEISKSATIYSIIDTLHKKIHLVPESVIEMAIFFRPEDDVWKTVLSVMDDELKDIRTKKKKKNHDD